MNFVLVSGVPSAGKTSFANWVEQADDRFAHIPLDAYVLPVPFGNVDLTRDDEDSGRVEFLSWVRQDTCVDWDLLREHVAILAAGHDCRTPKSDWSRNGMRLSAGGIGAGTGAAGDDGPHICKDARVLKSGRSYYMVVGTHAYGFSDTARCRAKVFIDTPEHVIAQRLRVGADVSADQVADIIEYSLADNCEPILAQRGQADLIVSGLEERRQQYESLASCLGIEPVQGQVE